LAYLGRKRMSVIAIELQRSTDRKSQREREGERKREREREMLELYRLSISESVCVPDP